VRRPIVLLGVLLLGLLALMAAKNALTQAPPVRTSSATGEFDAVRAKARLAFILGSQTAHPADTAADGEVRARLITTLQQLGLKPILRDQLACNELYKQRGVSCARVRNVIAVLGPSSGKAVLLNAHYDSTPVGPGAADDGIGVATLLEVASILKDRPLKRPVILLFNEGEELGLVGARAFLSDPLSRRVDSLINLEARGVRGPANMFETSRPNGAAIAVYRAAVKSPVANSLSTDVYRLLPNYTDVNSFSERGWLILNLAPIGNETRYHSAGDDIAALYASTLQHMGDQTLALTGALANGKPRAASSDRMFMDIAGRMLVVLPLWLGALMLGLLLVCAAAIAMSGGGIARGAGVMIGSILGSAATTALALAVLYAVRGGMFWRAEPIWTHLATYASVILAGIIAIATLGRGTSQRQLRASFWLVFLIVGTMIGLIAPGGIIFFIFPPLAALAGILLSRFWRPAELVGSALAIVILYLTWGAMLGLLEELLNDGPMWAFAPLGALLLLPILIEAANLIRATRLHDAVLVAGGLTLAAWSVVAAVPAYSADRQQRFVVQHVFDASANKSWWAVINGSAPLPHAYRPLGPWKRGKLPFSERVTWNAAAPADPASQAPRVQLLSVTRNGDERTLLLRLFANGNDTVGLIAPEDAEIRSAGVEGFVRPIDPNDDGKYSISCFGRSCDGVTLRFTTDQPKPILFTLVGARPGLPTSAAPLLAGRPPLARPQYVRDGSISFTRLRL